MAALMATVIVTAPFFESPPTAASGAVSYALTLMWWEPGAGALWLSVLALTVWLATETEERKECACRLERLVALSFLGRGYS